MRIKLIACEIFYREFCQAVSDSANQVDVEFLPKGLHDVGKDKMRELLQEALDHVPAQRFDRIALGYGLCNLGLVGLRTTSHPLVVPRAHDCITLFMGCRKRYQEYFDKHAGVYFKTTGWVERGDIESGDEQLQQYSIQYRQGLYLSYNEMVKKFGEDNAKYLHETLGDLMPHYQQFTYINMGMKPDTHYAERAKREAEEKGFTFEMVQGDMKLIKRLLDGPWDEDDFLSVPPHHQIYASYDEKLIYAERINHEQP